MHLLAKTLEQFNRKERNLLIRDILGCRDIPQPLDACFRKRVGDALGIDIDPDAWWATDYHIDWLAGALLQLLGNATEKERLNTGVVAGNQEDFDLVIASADDLILIEAKGYTYFTNSQIESKMGRLRQLYAHYKELKHDSTPEIRFHFLTCSPYKTEKLKPQVLPWEQGPAKELRWIPLMLPQYDSEYPVLAVTRCDCNCVAAGSGGYWRCKPDPRYAKAGLAW